MAHRKATNRITSLNQILRGIVIGQRREVVESQVRGAGGFDDDVIHESVSQEREKRRGLLWVWLRERVLHISVNGESIG